jgi:hypothetical protein
MLKSKVYNIIFMLTFLSALVLAIAIIPCEGATRCKMNFNLQGWSVFYQTASGAGDITCDNGQSAKVKIEVKGGGLTAGKYKLRGTGVFSEVADISELYGSYGYAEAHAGVVKSAGAQVVTKGDVSLAIKATGKGIDLGIAFGKFRIDPVGKKSEK